MKRSMPWNGEEDESSDESSLSSQEDTESEDESEKTKARKAKGKSSQGKSQKVNFEALKQHGYKGGLSILSVPPPKEDEHRDWSWSNGKEGRDKKESEESYQERQKTRAAIMDGEQLAYAQTRRELNEKKNLSFSQKEKRKRELGQASRGKNYVEEEKRQLRESGVYSGFDT